jgi:hypothetical protein
VTTDPVTDNAPGSELRWSDPAADQFEFWHGRWRAETVAGGTDPPVVAFNEVTWLWGRAVLFEDFSMPAGRSQFHGRSISVPVAGRGWCQTWVDSNRQYLDFVGGRVDDEMILDRTVTRADGSFVRQRMRWWDIASDTFSWDWLRASDASAEWELHWRLRYTRVTAVTQARADEAGHDRIQRRSRERTSP